MSDWMWRPSLWTRAEITEAKDDLSTGTQLSEDVTLFHDCAEGRVSAGQPISPQDHPSLELACHECDGSFCSIVIDLPVSAIEKLSSEHLFQVDLMGTIDPERSLYMRMNVTHGPNTAQITRQANIATGHARGEFDLAHSGVREVRIEKAWLDVIFEHPGTATIHLTDLTLSRRLRAAF